MIVELLCSRIGTFFTKLSHVIHRIYFMQVWYCLQPIFVIFFIILRNRLAHYGQKVRSGALMRTAAMTETRVARDGDRQHVKHGPG